jgi:hypothetical protein
VSNSSSRLPLYLGLGFGLFALLGLCCVGVGAAGFLVYGRSAPYEDPYYSSSYAPEYSAPGSGDYAAPAYADYTPATPPLGYHTVSGLDWSFSVPDGWTQMDYPGVLSTYVSQNPVAGFSANVNVTNESFYGSVDDYLAAARLQIGTMANVTGDTVATMGSLPARDLNATWAGPNRSTIQRIAVTSGRAWIVTCTVGEAEAANLHAICTPILDTARVR